MLRVAALIFSVWVLLSGCSGDTYPSYSKLGSIETDFKQDSDACMQDFGAASASTAPASPEDAKREASRYRMCMEARGWTAE